MTPILFQREQKQERLETEQDRQAAQGRIKKLEKEKHMLETEVLSNMKRLEQEAQESQKVGHPAVHCFCLSPYISMRDPEPQSPTDQ